FGRCSRKHRRRSGLLLFLLGLGSGGSGRLGFFSLLLGLGLDLGFRLGDGRSGRLGGVGSESAGGEERGDQGGQKFVHLNYLSLVLKSASRSGRPAHNGVFER